MAARISGPEPNVGPTLASDVTAMLGQGDRLSSTADLTASIPAELQGVEDDVVEPDIGIPTDACLSACSPPASAPPSTSPSIFGEWGSATVDVATDRACFTPRAAQLDSLLQPGDPMTFFMHFLPPRILENVVRGSVDIHLTQEELLAFIGLQIMASNHVFPVEELFEPYDDEFDRRPLFTQVMSLRRFREIAGGLRLNEPNLCSNDPCYQIRGMVDAFNEHMGARAVFTPSCTVCLDKSTVTHHNDRVPGYTYAGRKPDPVGNDYHAMYDVHSRVLYHMELVEGAARTAHLPLRYAEHGKVSALILRMTESSWGKGRVVVMDSEFCTLPALVLLKKRGTFAVTVAKKGRSWPKYVPGDVVQTDMAGRPVGELHGRSGQLDGERICLFSINHQKYVLTLLSTYGSSVQMGPERKVRLADGTLIGYRRNEPIEDYYQGRHAVDEHQRLRQSHKHDLERAWGNKSWDVRQLTFIVSVVLVNALLWYKYRCKPETPNSTMTMPEFRTRVADGLLTGYLKHKARQTKPHKLVSLPAFQGSTPGKRVKKKYQAVRCRGDRCRKMVRRHCKCSATLFLCDDCFVDHLQAAI
ncbi:uncharacterized protein MONBRDRAFT_8844 [Monosiga brevicollis MX1]|uniref:PiggyBac transposable element-derived protein domain-containing protein n=1 Tax=Monosiga brevicollis TaxID=81824 RepID=A9V1A6_MONBE|nr:uncharacterized protein MONBRDRAFT_8844 [Monosiga brevicollis MX1]EDQ88899.1 predicted protein [Monosiga brevicollis MX1]|eukprot:XP_001746512.1 hypothetical protein [Monosiga brevicollis MX1]